MEGDHWPHGSCDGAGGSLARLRKRASEFFESLPVAELAREAHRQLWLSDWLRVADDYRAFARAAREDGLVRVAREAWLCSLTASEVARTLTCPGDIARTDLADQVSSPGDGIEDDLGEAIERLTIDCHDDGSLTGFFVPASRHERAAPVVICVSDENITLRSMMSRLLPASLRRNMSLLVVDPGNPSNGRRLKPEHMLQCWLDHLETRPDVDGQRIAIYGEGAGAGHASRLALAERRIAAAVCDGGLLTSALRRASIRWMTGFERAVHEDGSTDSLLPPPRIPCPLLMVVGSRSMLREEDALELQAGYRQAGGDCSIVVPNCIPHPLGEVENFVAVDDFIFEWLDSRLGAAARQIDSVVYL